MLTALWSQESESGARCGPGAGQVRARSEVSSFVVGLGYFPGCVYVCQAEAFNEIALPLRLRGGEGREGSFLSRREMGSVELGCGGQGLMPPAGGGDH